MAPYVIEHIWKVRITLMLRKSAPLFLHVNSGIGVNLFPSLHNDVDRLFLKTHEELKTNITMFFSDSPKEFHGIIKLVNDWKDADDNDWTYSN